MAGGGGQSESEDLPQANVKRVVKVKLAELAQAHFGEEKDVPVNKDALLAFSESAKIFIHFLSATYVLSISFDSLAQDQTNKLFIQICFGYDKLP